MQTMRTPLITAVMQTIKSTWTLAIKSGTTAVSNKKQTTYTTAIIVEQCTAALQFVPLRSVSTLRLIITNRCRRRQ